MLRCNMGTNQEMHVKISSVNPVLPLTGMAPPQCQSHSTTNNSFLQIIIPSLNNQTVCLIHHTHLSLSRLTSSIHLHHLGRRHRPNSPTLFHMVAYLPHTTICRRQHSSRSCQWPKVNRHFHMAYLP